MSSKDFQRNFVVTDIFLYKAFIIASFQKNNLLLSKFMVIKSILYKISCYRKFSIHNFLLLKVFAVIFKSFLSITLYNIFLVNETFWMNLLIIFLKKYFHQKTISIENLLLSITFSIENILLSITFSIENLLHKKLIVIDNFQQKISYCR